MSSVLCWFYFKIKGGKMRRSLFALRSLIYFFSLALYRFRFLPFPVRRQSGKSVKIKSRKEQMCDVGVNAGRLQLYFIHTETVTKHKHYLSTGVG